MLPAGAPATFTFPSHMAMFQGMLPDVRHRAPFYNRFITQLWRRPNRSKTPKIPRVEHASGKHEKIQKTFCQTPLSNSAISGLAEVGYRTIGTAAMGWFQHPLLQEAFQDFWFSGLGTPAQISHLKKELSNIGDAPFFAFLNIGETHAPYCFGADIGTQKERLLDEEYERLKREQQLMPGQPPNREYLARQIAAIEYLEPLIEDMLQWMSERFGATVVVLCGDHGDVMGEDNLWGHGFYHPAVMEVPLSIFELGGKDVLAPLRPVLGDLFKIADQHRQNLAKLHGDLRSAAT